MKQGNPKKYYFLRLLLAIVLAPLIAIPLMLLMFSAYSAFYEMAMALLPYVYLFTCLWGGFAHVVLVKLGRTELRYYIACYLLAALTILIVLMEGHMDWIMLGALSSFLVAGIAVATFAWWLFYKGLTRIKL